MIRIAISFAGGVVLVFIEAYIVILLKGYSGIDFGGITPFMNVWAMNFFLLFSVCTHIKLWIENRETSHHSTY